MPKPQNTTILFVTGLSGAGRSSALKVFEDMGYEVFDNIPIQLVDGLLAMESDVRKMAVGIDTRTRYFSPDDLLNAMRRIDQDDNGIAARLVFMKAEEAVLQKRFSETRRRHPMAQDRSVQDGIRHEMDIMGPLLGAADYVIDTSDFSVHDLRDDLQHKFSDAQVNNMLVTVKSFGFKKGLPRDVDMVFDVRFLRNPHWDEALRPLTGQYKKVANYIEDDEDFAAFWQNVTNMMDLLMPRYQKEGKSYLTIGFGCMGGKHRSVFCTERLGDYLREKGLSVQTQHRDMPEV
ncbi:MAG: RNase adapter RapZ [Pseudomonadota bacterium]|nr:RNase adapter RapZ [Alphaproteobacteria bacterium]MEC7702937.1 RNase adapter RapZ [Pseudomonadota bacterium]MEC9235442.1 RNase adapter RapZ [Pseudomonadota bacterium]MED5423693.1 RNase adapter RapZ [Pseudomonadota bacterium]MEE3323593.1 RNase adapter RapZ [Pseudomonadota bacterium]